MIFLWWWWWWCCRLFHIFFKRKTRIYWDLWFKKIAKKQKLEIQRKLFDYNTQCEKRSHPALQVASNFKNTIRAWKSSWSSKRFCTHQKSNVKHHVFLHSFSLRIPPKRINFPVSTTIGIETMEHFWMCNSVFLLSIECYCLTLS